ncbi:MAG: ferric uptake regulator family [Geobacteraceae bacterium]|nr:MAG: ferric uptake regulator family [Geobacteraceae bacterium]
MHDHGTYPLKDLNLKTTPKRVAILNLLAQESTYISPEEIWRKLKGQFSRVGLPTVYRNLEELAAGGIISKVIHPNRQLYYYFCPNRDHHHHFICVACRRVEDVDYCGMEDVERQVSERIGGRVLSHIVQVNGLCRSCSAKGGNGESTHVGVMK